MPFLRGQGVYVNSEQGMICRTESAFFFPSLVAELGTSDDLQCVVMKLGTAFSLHNFKKLHYIRDLTGVCRFSDINTRFIDTVLQN